MKDLNTVEWRSNHAEAKKSIETASQVFGIRKQEVAE